MGGGNTFLPSINQNFKLDYSLLTEISVVIINEVLRFLTLFLFVETNF